MKLKTQTLILTYLLTTFFVSSQWIQTNGPQGGKLQEIVEVNNVLILSAEDGGLYRSDDDGNSWRAINAGFPCNVSIRSLISDNGLVYVLTKENGIFKSEDLGTNWESINNNIADLTFNAIYANGSNLYAANEDGGVFFSPSAGTNWVEKSTGVAMELFEGFANFNGGIYAAGNSLYSTLDNGDTWNPISLPSLISGGIKFISATANTLFITDDNAVFFSTGNLASWTAATVNTGAPIVSLETFGNRIYLTTSEGRIFFSDNEGVSWGQIQNTTTNRFAEHALFSNSKIFMSTSEGLFSSTTNGQTWVENNNGIKAVNITSMHAEGATVYVGTESQHIFRSDDNGQSWTRLRNGLISIASSHVSDIIAYNGALLIATDDGVYQSNDNGNNWVKILNPSPGNHVGALTTRDQILVAAVSGEGVYRSFDDGQTWSLLNGAGLGINTEYESAVILNSTILVTASNGRIYETTDLGLNWGEVSITNGFTLAYKLLLHE
ncbi:MAG: YCF48-related protein, partial [Flavobacteriaceae bacterium]